MKKMLPFLILAAVLGCGGGSAEEKGKAIFNGVTDAVVTATNALENAKSEDEVRNGLLKFSVAVSKQGLAMKTFEIRHPGTNLLTDEAFKAYEKVAYPFLIEILDGDEKSTEILLKEVKYNFPQEYVRSGQIEIDKTFTTTPRIAKIKMVPITVAVPATP